MLTLKDAQATLAVTVNKKIHVFCQPLVSKKDIHFHAIILGLQTKMDLSRLYLRHASLSPTATEGTQMAVQTGHKLSLKAKGEGEGTFHNPVKSELQTL